MRHLRRRQLTEYLYHGVFYTTETIRNDDGSVLDEDRENMEIIFHDDEIDPDAVVEDTINGRLNENILLEVECDILQAAKMFNNGTIVGDYDVYFPTKKGEKLPIRLGVMFRCDDFPIAMNGMVVGLDPTQMGCKAQIKLSEAYWRQ